MRRKDREISREEALNVADRCEWGTLATVNTDGTPYCIPISIARLGEIIYFHCATEGQKLDNIRIKPEVCISCATNVQIIPGKFTTAFDSAVIYGTAKIVTDEKEKIEALRAICIRYTPDNMDDFDDAIANSLSRTAIVAVKIRDITGKRKPYKA